MFADHIISFSNSEESLKFNLNILDEELEKINMLINTDKQSKLQYDTKVTLKRKERKRVKANKYLGVVTTENGRMGQT